MDRRTRWSSLLDMLQRFLLLKVALPKAIEELNRTVFTANDFEIIQTIISTLSPLKITVLALCRPDMDLAKADIAMKMMMNEIKKESSELSRRMNKSLEKRILAEP